MAVWGSMRFGNRRSPGGRERKGVFCGGPLSPFPIFAGAARFFSNFPPFLLSLTVSQYTLNFDRIIKIFHYFQKILDKQIKLL